jgi:hypothetical protein
LRVSAHILRAYASVLPSVCLSASCLSLAIKRIYHVCGQLALKRLAADDRGGDVIEVLLQYHAHPLRLTRCQSRTHIHTCTHMHTHTHMHASAIHASAISIDLSETVTDEAHKHTHTHTHTHTQPHIHTCTQTHTTAPVAWSPQASQAEAPGAART